MQSKAQPNSGPPSRGFVGLLVSNRNYRFMWTGQVVSEVGDHFNNIAVFSLVLANTGSGMAVAGILLARGAAVMLAPCFRRERGRFCFPVRGGRVASLACSDGLVADFEHIPGRRSK